LTARSLFYGADGRLHPPWRIVLFLLLSALCFAIVAIVLHPLIEIVNRLTGLDDTGETVAATIALLMAHAITLRWRDRHPWSYVWLDTHAARPRVLLLGFLVGALPIALAALALVDAGWLAIVPSPPGPWIRGAMSISFLLLPAALSEELISRGYLFATLGEWLGWPATVAVSSVAFGLLHLGNPGATARPILMVILAGAYLAVVLLATKSLYATWMAHFGWNWIMAVPLHIAVSGIAVPRPDYQTVDAGPDWITGGAWGPEGGAGAALGMFGGFAYLYWRSRKKHERLEG
jgi:hypothetical protein